MIDDNLPRDLAWWLFEEHPLFRGVGTALTEVLSEGGPSSLDQLVLRSRYQVRTVLLSLSHLNDRGLIRPDGDGCVMIPSSRPLDLHITPQVPPRANTFITSRYLADVAQREQPVLVWGQRRLVPSSAIERADYLDLWAQATVGKAIFLGDDDLVSPLFAALHPRWDVTVVDIDREVLERATVIAEDLGATVRGRHEDISCLMPGLAGEFDIAVADPFPTVDGSFEFVFWSYAKALLKRGGWLISTTAPSHKPLEYSKGALAMLASLGFTLQDLRANFGRYEVFDFEFTDFEKEVLSRLDLKSSVAHTKSLFAATNTGEHEAQLKQPEFDFHHWTNAALGHYLTSQAGVGNQQTLAHDRGLSTSISTSGEGYGSCIRLAGIFPKPLSDAIDAAKDTHSLKQVLATQLDSLLNISSTDDEREELARLTTNGLQDAVNPKVALAIRAIDSWGRRRLDDK